MAITPSWSNPEAAVGSGGLEVASGATVPSAWANRLASMLDWVAGTTGVINQAGIAVGSSSNPTTTNTSYVDATDMTVALTPVVGSTRIIAFGSSSVANSDAGGDITLALSLDGAAEVGARTHRQQATTNADITTVIVFHMWEGVSAAAHTIKMRWRVAAGTGTLLSTQRGLLVVQFK